MVIIFLKIPLEVKYYLDSEIVPILDFAFSAALQAVSECPQRH